MVRCSSYLYTRNVGGVTVYCCMLYIIILMHMYYFNYKICYYLDTLTSCHFKGFPDPVRFHFRGDVSFGTMLR